MFPVLVGIFLSFCTLYRAAQFIHCPGGGGTCYPSWGTLAKFREIVATFQTSYFAKFREIEILYKKTSNFAISKFREIETQCWTYPPSAHCPLPTVYCLLSTVHCPLPTVNVHHSMPAHCLLPAPLYPLSTVQCPMPTAYCPLFTAHYLLPTLYCPLFTATTYCPPLLPTVYCPLLADCFLWSSAHCHCPLSSAYSPLSTARCPLWMLYICGIFGSVSFLNKATAG
jgi:hypothetical protein